MPRKTKHRYDVATSPALAAPVKPLRYTPIGRPLRLRVHRVAVLERPEVADINVTLIPRERELAKLSPEEQAEALRAAEHLTARDFTLVRKTGELELDNDFLRQFFTVKESGGEFQYDGTGECYTHNASYEYLEDI